MLSTGCTGSAQGAHCSLAVRMQPACTPPQLLPLLLYCQAHLPYCPSSLEGSRCSGGLSAGARSERCVCDSAFALWWTGGRLLPSVSGTAGSSLSKVQPLPQPSSLQQKVQALQPRCFWQACSTQCRQGVERLHELGPSFSWHAAISAAGNRRDWPGGEGCSPRSTRALW